MNDTSKLAIKAIEEMVETDTLSQDLYHKYLFELAHNAFRDGDLDGCIQIVGKIQPEYFKTVQLEQMKEDETYKTKVIYLAYKFIQMGVVEAGLEPVATQNQKGIA